MDFGIGVAAMEPGGQCCGGANGITVGSTVTGDDDMVCSGEERLQKGDLLWGKKGYPPLTLPVREGVVTYGI